MSPKIAIEWNNEGLDFYLAKKFDEAIVAFLKAIELDKTNPIFYKNLGDAYYDSGKKTEGLNYYKTALKMDEKNPAFLLDYAMLLHTEKQDRLALTNLSKALEIDPQNPDILYQLIIIYYSLKEFQSALSFCQRLLKITPNNQDVLLIQIRCYFDQNNYPAAEQTLEKLLNINPHHSRALYLGSQLYQQEKKQSKAIELLQRAYEADKNNPAIVESIFEFYEQEFLFGRLYSIVAQFRENHPVVDSYLGKRIKQPADLLDYYILGKEFREALKVETQDLSYQFKAEDSDKVVEMIENLFSRIEKESQQDPNLENSKLLHALVLLTQKKFPEAFEIIGKMFGKVASELYYFLLGILWLLNDSHESSCKSWNIFIKNGKSDASILLFYSYSAYKMEQIESAEELLQECHKICPQWQVYFPTTASFNESSIKEDLFGLAFQKIMRYLKQIKDLED